MGRARRSELRFGPPRQAMSPLLLRARRREWRFGPRRQAMYPFLLSPAVNNLGTLFLIVLVIRLHDLLSAEINVAWAGVRLGHTIVAWDHFDKLPALLIDETTLGLRGLHPPDLDGGHESVTLAGKSLDVPIVF